MKLTQIIAAGLLMAGVGVSTEASAQRHDGYSQQYRGDHDGRWNNGNDRRDHRWDRRNNGNHYGWRNNHRQNCRTEWRHHQRVRICR